MDDLQNTHIIEFTTNTRRQRKQGHHSHFHSSEKTKKWHQLHPQHQQPQTKVEQGPHITKWWWAIFLKHNRHPQGNVAIIREMRRLEWPGRAHTRNFPPSRKISQYSLQAPSEMTRLGAHDTLSWSAQAKACNAPPCNSRPRVNLLQPSRDGHIAILGGTTLIYKRPIARYLRLPEPSYVEVPTDFRYVVQYKVQWQIT